MATMAVTIALTVVMAKGLRSADVRREFHAARRVIARDVGVVLRPRFRRRPLPAPDLSREAVAVWDYAPFAAEAGERTLIIPVAGRNEYGLKASSGQATICGSIAVASFGPRAEWTRRTIAHEIGHMLGAAHSVDGGIMSPDPIGAEFRFREESTMEVMECLSLIETKR